MLHRTSLEKVVYSFGVTSEAVFSKYGPRWAQGISFNVKGGLEGMSGGCKRKV